MQAKNSTLSILVVDDDAMVRSIVVEYLENLGFKNIFAAEDGSAALKLIQDAEYSIDLIISDWEMPEVTGLTLLKAVRNSPQRLETPFIMMTSQRSMERFKISQAAQWQVSAYVLKPFRQDALRSKVWEVLGWNEAAA
jgi:two-component system chemotaxis response regulator CheY